MFKYVVVFAILTFVAMTSAHAGSDYPAGRFKEYTLFGQLKVIVDNKTGCEYFEGSTGGVTLIEGSCTQK